MSHSQPRRESDTHGRQGAVYVKAHGNYGMRFAYVKPVAGETDGRAVVVYEISADDVRRHLTALHQIALRLGRFLSLSSDPHELAGLLVPDFEHFWWTHRVLHVLYEPSGATSSQGCRRRLVVSSVRLTTGVLAESGSLPAARAGTGS